MKTKRDAERLTMLMDAKIVKKLREKQIEALKTSKKGVSFSHVVNEELAKSLGIKRDGL